MLSEQNLSGCVDQFYQAKVNLCLTNIAGNWRFRRGSIWLGPPSDYIAQSWGNLLCKEVLFSFKDCNKSQIERIINDSLRVKAKKELIDVIYSNRGVASEDFTKTILIAPWLNSDGTETNQIEPHVGIERIAYFLGSKTSFVDARTFNPNLAHYNKLLEILEREFISVIGVSISQFTLQNDAIIIKAISQISPNSLICAGGLNIDQLPHEVIANSLNVQAFIAGPGEKVMFELLSQVHLKGVALPDISLVPNIYYYDKKSGSVKFTFRNRSLFVTDIDPAELARQIPYKEPDATHGKSYDIAQQAIGHDEIIPFHMAGQRHFRTKLSDACSHRCVFCSISREESKPREISKVVSDIQNAVSTNEYDSVHMIDNDFFVFSDKVIELCDSLKKQQLHDIPKHCKGCADEVNPALASALVAAGFTSVGIGIESFSDSVLSAMNKNITAERNIKALGTLINYGAKPGIYLILFSPWETIESLIKTISTTLYFVARGAFTTVVPAMYTRLGDDFSSDVNNQHLIDFIGITGIEGLNVPVRSKSLDNRILRLQEASILRAKEWDERIVKGTTNVHIRLSPAVQGLHLLGAAGTEIGLYQSGSEKWGEAVSEIAQEMADSVFRWEHMKIVKAPNDDLARFRNLLERAGLNRIEWGGTHI